MESINNPFEDINRRLDRMEVTLTKLAERKPDTPPTTYEKFYTVEETAKVLSVSRTTLWSWEKKGILKSIRIGNLKRYRLSNIEALGQDKTIHSGSS